MSGGQLILVSAPSGAGKTSLLRAALSRDPRLTVAVSHTTRARRGNEKDGVNYYFVSEQEFAAMVQQQGFVEHAQVFDHRYGTSKREIDRLRATGSDVVLEIDWQGADQVRDLMPDAVSIFILPPSIRVLQQRLQARGEDSQASMQRRLAEAAREISQAPNFQYIIVNDDFERAVGDPAQHLPGCPPARNGPDRRQRPGPGNLVRFLTHL